MMVILVLTALCQLKLVKTDPVIKFKAIWNVWNNVTDDHDPLPQCFVDEAATKTLKCFNILWEQNGGRDTKEFLVFTDSHHKVLSCFEKGFSGCAVDQIVHISLNRLNVVHY